MPLCMSTPGIQGFFMAKALAVSTCPLKPNLSCLDAGVMVAVLGIWQ